MRNVITKNLFRFKISTIMLSICVFTLILGPYLARFGRHQHDVRNALLRDIAKRIAEAEQLPANMSDRWTAFREFQLDRYTQEKLSLVHAYMDKYCPNVSSVMKERNNQSQPSLSQILQKQMDDIKCLEELLKANVSYNNISKEAQERFRHEFWQFNVDLDIQRKMLLQEAQEIRKTFDSM